MSGDLAGDLSDTEHCTNVDLRNLKWAFRYKEEEDQSENNWRNRKYVRLTLECCDLYFLEECGHWDWSSWSSSQHICFPS